MKRQNILLPTAAFISVLLIWEAYVRISGTPVYILPAPSAVIGALISDYQNLLPHSLTTLWETVVGMAIAVILAILLAVVMDASRLIKTTIFPILVVSQTIPVIVLAPILIIYLGFGAAPKILTVVLMCFFPIAVNFTDAMARVDANQVNLVRCFGASKFQIYSIVKIPAAAPAFFSGMRVAATYSVTGAVVGEWLAAESGLGYYMLRLKNGYMLDRLFACVVMVVIMSLLMTGFVGLLCKNKVSGKP